MKCTQIHAQIYTSTYSETCVSLGYQKLFHSQKRTHTDTIKTEKITKSMVNIFFKICHVSLSRCHLRELCHISEWIPDYGTWLTFWKGQMNLGWGLGISDDEGLYPQRRTGGRFSWKMRKLDVIFSNSQRGGRYDLVHGHGWIHHFSSWVSFPVQVAHLPWRTMDPHNPRLTPHKCLHKTTGYGAWLALCHYSQMGWGWPPFHVPWFSQGLLRALLFWVRSHLHPSSIFWPQTRSRKSTPQEWHTTSEGQAVVGTHCSFWSLVGKPKACSTYPFRGSPVGLSPPAIAGTRSFT